MKLINEIDGEFVYFLKNESLFLRLYTKPEPEGPIKVLFLLV